MKGRMRWLLVCLVVVQLIVGASAASGDDPAADRERIIGIETPYFFNDLRGTFYIYFGSPNCQECAQFEPHLLEALEAKGQVVYHYDTAYWKDDGLYDKTLSNYHVDQVPLLVKTVDGEYRDAYRFDPDTTAEETATQLDAFLIERSDLFPVTTKEGFPMRFHDYLLAFTSIIMCVNACYVVWKRKDLAAMGHGSPLAWIVVSSTLLLALHIAIAGFGFGFALQYEAGPAPGLLAKVGTYTWLVVTPLLYVVVLGFAVKIMTKRTKSEK